MILHFSLYSLLCVSFVLFMCSSRNVLQFSGFHLSKILSRKFAWCSEILAELRSYVVRCAVLELGVLKAVSALCIGSC